MTCPDSELLAAYVDRRLPSADRDALEAHLAACDACRSEAVELYRLTRPATARRPTVAPRGTRRWGLAVAASVAAAALIVLGLSLRTSTPPAGKPVVVEPKPAPPEPPPLPPREPLVVPPIPERTKLPEAFVPPPTPKPDVEPVPTPTPEPPKPPAPEPPKPAPPTVAAIATLDRLEGRVSVNGAAAVAGQPLRPDDLLETAAGSVAMFSFPNQTRLELEPDASLRASSPDLLRLDKGGLKAEVARPMSIDTPHGTARVLGTVLRVHVSTSTTVEVERGKVELRTKTRSITVEAGKSASSAALSLKALPREEALFTFDGPRERGPNNRPGHLTESGKLIVGLDQLRVRGDEVLSFDYWVDPQAAQVNLHFWNSTRKMKHETVVTETSLGKWTHATYKLADLGLLPGDDLGNLFVQGTGGGPRRFYVDNLRLTRPYSLKPR